MGRGLQEIDLKLARANRHLDELWALVNPWRASEPYEVAERIEGQDAEYVYRLEFTKPLDETVPAVAGDVLHNIRASLDYLMSGLVPAARRRKTYYPIFAVDPFARDPQNRRKYLQRSPGDRRRWKSYTKGVEPSALGIIEEYQPFAADIRPGTFHLLVALKRLSDADKHRELMTVPVALEDAQLTVNGTRSEIITPRIHKSVKAGEELHRSKTPADVQIHGTPLVLIRVGGEERAEIRLEALTELHLFARGVLVGILAKYLRR
jgi:hypothetical protein